MNTFIRRAIFLAAVAGLPMLTFAAGTSTATQFVPLTSLPGLDDFTSSSDLPAFLNNIYKICIGAAAALAVFQIMRAGFYFMTNKGSVSENEQAKHLLQMSIFGLLLVLSPVIVFGIINPKILSLEFNTNALKVAETGAPADAATAAQTMWSQASVDQAAEKAKCESQGGVASYSCVKDGVSRPVPAGQACATGETPWTTCKAKEGNFGDMGTCSDYSISASGTGICNGGAGYTQINKSCCSNLAAGAVCCGKKKPTELELRAQVIVAQVLAMCQVQADANEKYCLEQRAVAAVQHYGTCVQAAGGDATKIAACGKAAEAEGRASAVCLTPTPSSTQMGCMEKTILEGIIKNS